MPLFSREHLLCYRAVAKNSEFNKFMGDSKDSGAKTPNF